MKAAVGLLGMAMLTGCGADGASPGGGRAPANAASGGAAADGAGGAGSGDSAGSGGNPGDGTAGAGDGGAGSNTGGTAPNTGGAAPNTGGAAPGTDAGAVDPTAIDRIDQNLERLRALDVFEVGSVIAPASSYCTTPCADPLWGRTATDLERFTNAAETAAQTPSFSYACTEDVDLNLTTLRALGVVDIGAILVATPANNPNCYNLPCQSDIDAAGQLNYLRDAKLEAIAVAVKAP
ncbi:MAG TPA: hypothetical protein VHE30_15455 [Polyangiaceae bacterium]|nr:hypothetical protein [Polyangiaceae bacterium]